MKTTFVILYISSNFIRMDSRTVYSNHYICGHQFLPSKLKANITIKYVPIICLNIAVMNKPLTLTMSLWDLQQLTGSEQQLMLPSLSFHERIKGRAPEILNSHICRHGRQPTVFLLYQVWTSLMKTESTQSQLAHLSALTQCSKHYRNPNESQKLSSAAVLTEQLLASTLHIILSHINA
jgi:hypothetical protein